MGCAKEFFTFKFTTLRFFKGGHTIFVSGMGGLDGRALWVLNNKLICNVQQELFFSSAKDFEEYNFALIILNNYNPVVIKKTS